MRTLSRAMTIVAAGAAALGLAALPAAAAATPSAATPSPAVFVQNDNPAGNVVFAYHRASDGTLTLANRYPTGGFGGVLAGSVVDHLASQGAVALDAAHGLLFAVNAGSDTVSVFAVSGDRLALRQTLRSGGSFPVSVTVSGNTAYVLNAREGGAVSGFRIDRQRVEPIARSPARSALTRRLLRSSRTRRARSRLHRTAISCSLRQRRMATTSLCSVSTRPVAWARRHSTHCQTPFHLLQPSTRSVICSSPKPGRTRWSASRSDTRVASPSSNRWRRRKSPPAGSSKPTDSGTRPTRVAGR